MKDVRILVAAHKPYPMPEDEMYLPIFVGAKGKTDIDLRKPFVRDDSGENISEKNPNFCELTALYWAWKNLKADYVGLCHYRRYFKGSGRVSGQTPEDLLKLAISKPELEMILEKRGIVLPTKRYYAIESLKDHWCSTLPEGPFYDTEKIIAEKCPEYLPEFKRLAVRRSMHAFNMFVMKRDIFDKYCEWLFPIIFELEKRTDISGFNDYQKRLFGMMSERLLDVWLFTNDLMKDSVEVPVVNLEGQNYLKKAMKMIGAKTSGEKYGN